MKESTLLDKAQMTVADLATGGKMNPMQFNQFKDMVMDTPTILPKMRFVAMDRDSMKIERIGIGQRLMRAGVENTALADADRTVPATDTITLTTHESVGEINISYDTLEENIERGSLHQHIMRLMAERWALDMEELVLNGDTASSDAFLALTDGVLKLANAGGNVVNQAGAGIDKAAFMKLRKAIPSRFIRNANEYAYFANPNIVLDYVNELAGRETQYGDSVLNGSVLSRPFGVPLYGASMLAANASKQSSVLLCNPKNLIFGVERNMRIEIDKDIRSRTFIIVLTSKVAVQVEEIKAVGLMTNVLEA